MQIAVFSTKTYDETSLTAANKEAQHEMHFLEARLTEDTSRLAEGYPVVSVFVNDVLNETTLGSLQECGTRLVALRCAGFNNVDLRAAAELGVAVVRVPAYSPHSVAEHTVALIMSLARKTHRAYVRVHYGNFSLRGLLGHELHGKTVGIIGSGTIGYLVARVMQAFGCRIIAYDLHENPACLDLGVQYCPLQQLYAEADIISLHCPLNQATHHMINAEAFAAMKTGVMLINTGRGAIIDSKAAIEAVKSGKVGSLGLDVYEQESDLFFEDLSNEIIADDVFQRLLTFPNVLITGHQGYFTQTALRNIAETTIENISQFASGSELTNVVDESFLA